MARAPSTQPSIHLKGATLDLPVRRRLRAADADAGSAVGANIVRTRMGHVVRALDGIDLDVEAGQRLAVIGHNGAGKTTLLRLIAGIYQPTSGMRRVEGTVTCLLTSSLGLSPKLSGRENISLACALYGMSRAEVRAARPGIEAFSELGPYLDLPLAAYSAGMKTRLGMSIITSLDPDILVIDEVFGAGDSAFAEKARARLMEMLERSRILVFSSHSESILRQLCTTAVLVERGRIVASGTVDETLLAYRTAWV